VRRFGQIGGPNFIRARAKDGAFHRMVHFGEVKGWLQDGSGCILLGTIHFLGIICYFEDAGGLGLKIAGVRTWLIWG
jgi:hypothetical protein